MAEEFEFNISDYKRIIFRQFRFIFIVAAVLTVIGLVIGNRMPRRYKVSGVLEADFEVFFEGADVNPSLTRDLKENLSVMIVDIKSYTMLLRVARILGAVSDTVSEKNIIENKDVLEEIEHYREHLKLEPIPAEKRIVVSTISGDPYGDSALVTAVCQTYRDYSLEKKQAYFRSREEKVGEALEICHEQLEEIADRTVEIRRLQKGLINEGYLNQQKKRLKNIRRDQQAQEYLLTIISLQLRECERIRIFISDQLTPSAKQEGHAPLMPDLSFLDKLGKKDRGLVILRRRLKQLIDERKEGLQYFTPRHPKITALHHRILATLDEITAALHTSGNRVAAAEKRLEIRYGTLEELLVRKHVDDYMLNWLKVKYESQEEICESIEAELAELQVSESGLVPYITIVKDAAVPRSPLGFGTFKTGILGMAAGLLLGIVFSLFREIADTSFHTIEDVRRVMGKYGVLAIVPVISKRKKRFGARGNSEPVFREWYHDLLPLFFDRLCSAAESFKLLAARSLTAAAEGKGTIVQITSTLEQEGKTVIAANLAIALAQQGREVLLLDADFRSPALAPLFGLSPTVGLTQILIEEKTMDESRMTVTDVAIGKYTREELVQLHGINNLDIILFGTFPPNPAELLSSPAMRTFMTKVKDEYDFIIVDSPPLIRVADPVVISRNCDRVIVVYESGRAPRKLVINNLKKLEMTGANVEGLILNLWTDEYENV